MLLDLNNEVLLNTNINNATLSASTQGGSADWATSGDGEFSLNMLVQAFIQTVANLTSFVVQAEESDTGTGSWTVVSGVATAQYSTTQMMITVTGTTALANTQQSIQGLRTKRYIRANLNTYAAGTTTGSGVVTVTFFSQKKRQPGFGTGEGGISRAPSN